MTDTADANTVKTALLSLSFSRLVLEKMRNCTIGALLNGRGDLLELETAQVKFWEDVDGGEFLVLAGLPLLIRHEFLSKYRPAAFLLEPKLALAAWEDWVAFVETLG